MKKRLTVWKAVFVLGIAIILFSYTLSRFTSNEYALVIAGSILSIWSGAGILLELYKKD